MSLKFITVYSGGEHIEATDDAEIFKAGFGSGNFVFDYGGKLAITILPTAGTVTLADGVFLFDGRMGRVIVSHSVNYTPPASESLWKKIAVVFRYSKNSSTGIESGSLVCVQSSTYSSKTTAEAQNLNIGGSSIQSSTTVADFLLYEFVCNSNSFDELTTYFALKSSTSNLESYADSKATAAYLSAKNYTEEYSAPVQLYSNSSGAKSITLSEPISNFREIVIHYSVNHLGDIFFYQERLLTACLPAGSTVFLDGQRIWAYEGGVKKIMYSVARFELSDDLKSLSPPEKNSEAANTNDSDVTGDTNTKIHAVYGIIRK